MKIKNRVLSIVCAVAMMCGMVGTAFASEQSGAADETKDLGDLIKVVEYTDENGNEVVEEFYFEPDPGSSNIAVNEDGGIAVAANDSGSGWFTNKKTMNNSDGKTTMYAKGYFVWGNGDVSVSNPTGWCEGVVSTVTISNEKYTTGTGKFLVFFTKYAYAEYSFTSTNAFGYSQQNSVRVTVDANGNVS